MPRIIFGSLIRETPPAARISSAKAHLSEGDRIAYDKAVDRYNVSRIVENDIREQAVAEGRLEGRLEIARKLKENGFSIADIVRIAGLSPEEIDKL